MPLVSDAGAKKSGVCDGPASVHRPRTCLSGSLAALELAPIRVAAPAVFEIKIIHKSVFVSDSVGTGIHLHT